MRNYAIHDANGVIRQTATLPDESDPPLIDGLLTTETDEPIDGTAWHIAGGLPVAGLLDLRTLAERKVDKWAELKSARDAQEFGFFVWDGSTFDANRESQSRVQGAAQLATLAQLAGQLLFSVDWTLADNSVRTLTGAQMLEVGQAMGTHIMTTHAIGRALRDTLMAATTIAEVEAITWNG